MSKHHTSIASPPKPIGSKSQKVKVYFLGISDSWVDLGIGSLFLVKEFNDQTEELEDYIQVQAASSDEIVHTTELEDEEIESLNRNLEERIIIKYKFNLDSQYDQQNDSIIICKEPTTSLEFAISFTDSDSMNDFWEFLKKSGVKGMHGDFNEFANQGLYNDLQLPEVDKLLECQESIELNITYYSQAILYKPQFLEELFEIFKKLEEEKDILNLEIIHHIVRRLILTNEQKLITILVSDRFFMFCLGAFEYKVGGVKENFREIQLKESNFRQIIEIKDEDVLNKIHMNYRLQFVKDCIIASYIDESTTSIQNLIMNNNIEIIDFVKEKSFMQDFRSKFLENLTDSIQFLSELLAILTGIHFMNRKQQIAEAMNNQNFLVVLFDSLKHIQDNESDRLVKTKQILKLMEVITLLASENKKELMAMLFGGAKSLYTRKGLDEQESQTNGGERSYLKQVSSLLIFEETGIQTQVLEVLRTLFGQMKESDFDTEAKNLIFEFLFIPCIEHFEKAEVNIQFVNFVIQFFEVFSIIYKWCPAKFRTDVISKDLLTRIFLNAERKAKAVQLALIKFIRSLIDSDLMITSYVIRTVTIETIWKIYIQHERKPNLINSAFQDMLQHLLVSNFSKNKKLYLFFMNSYGEELKKRASKSPCFKKLLDLQSSGQSQDEEDSTQEEESDYLKEQKKSTIQQREIADEEKYFDSDDNTPEDEGRVNSNLVDIENNAQKKELLKEKIFKHVASEEDDEDENQMFFGKQQKDKSAEQNSLKHSDSSLFGEISSSIENNRSNNSTGMKIDISFSLDFDDNPSSSSVDVEIEEISLDDAHSIKHTVDSLSQVEELRLDGKLSKNNKSDNDDEDDEDNKDQENKDEAGKQDLSQFEVIQKKMKV